MTRMEASDGRRSFSSSSNGLLPEVFDNTFQYARNIHRYNTRYSAKQNFYKSKIKTNAGKQSLSYMAIDTGKTFHLL